MKIVILCTKYPLESGNSYLTSDLGTALARMGHSVSVVCLDWESKSPEGHYKLADDIDVYNFEFKLISFLDKISPIRRFLKWMFFSTIVRFKLPKKLRDEKIDLLIDFSPATTTRSVFSYLKKLHKSKSFMILWDFFPYYHYELGLLPKPMFPFLKWIEESEINSHEYIGCMSDENVNYLNKKYKVCGKVKTLVLPLWGPKEAPMVESKSSFDQFEFDKVYCVFGGQLIPGRGVNLIIDLAKKCKNVNKNIVFLVAGDGPLKDWLENSISENGLDNVRYLGQLSRDKYFDLLGHSSIGLVFNSGHVSVPTYPSKTIDYFRCKLPILGAVESATDYRDIIQNQVKAGFCSVANQLDEIYSNLVNLSNNPTLRKKFGENGYQYFQKHMTSEAVARQILKESSL
jgi:glycosyltransferase involved in cell wall biosynthesis